jgi:ribosome-associated heat shock protein Hsp15
MAKRRRAERQDAGEEGEVRVRLDQWLWAARFFKTRALAAKAVAGGKVELNEARPKRAHLVRPGDRLRLRLGPFEHVLTVRALAARRGPAEAARALYDEDAASVAGREELARRLKAGAASFARSEGRPTRQERRALERWRGRRGQ